MKESYLAGIIDGEGCISITGRQLYSVQIQVVNTSKRLIEYLHNNFGGSFHLRKRRTLKHRPLYSWLVSASAARRILKKCYPYLIVKKSMLKLFLR